MNQPLETHIEKKEDTWEEEGWEEEDVQIDTQEEDFGNNDYLKNEETQQQDWLNEPISPRSDKLHSIATIAGLQKMEYKTPEEKLSIREIWSRMARCPSEYVMSGRLEDAIEMLKTELGFISLEPLKSLFMELYITSYSCVSMLPSLDSVPIYMLDTWQRRNTPKPYYRFEQMEKLMTLAEQKMTVGKFSEAFNLYRQLIITLPFIIVDNDSQCSLCMEMLTTCREYIIGLMIRTKQSEAKSKGDTLRQLELAALMTHCNMLITHQQLALQAAMKIGICH
ncbi:Coatomer subunit alpha-2 [Galdieria sulphuraria]|nr:Coatomer subunit alpha-2 [Galdieria sulphuraria]